MAVYRIFRIKDAPRQQFRWAPHVSGATVVRPRDYEEDATVEAANVYAAWSALHGAPGELRIGDLLAAGDGSLRIVKYVGFEEASWATPEPRLPLPEVSAAAGQPLA